MTSCQISLEVIHLFLASVFLNQDIWSVGTFYKKSSNAVVRWKKEAATMRILLYKIQHKSIYVVCWRKRAGRRNLHAMFVWEKFKTLCSISNWIQQSIQKNIGSGFITSITSKTKNRPQQSGPW